jgi:hypothetical protein
MSVAQHGAGRLAGLGFWLLPVLGVINRQLETDKTEVSH